MTGFTYRFVPAMRYMEHLVAAGDIGQPYTFRSQRFQDWGIRSLGWRQHRELAGTGEVGDMLSHRIDFAHLLVGRLGRLVAETRNFVGRRDGEDSDVEDWVGLIAGFALLDAVATFESTKLAAGHGEGLSSHDYCEVNGSEGTLVYELDNPNQALVGKPGGQLQPARVPDDFLVWPGSKRDPRSDPRSFTWDQDLEFVSAIQEQRACRPSFVEGVRVQSVMSAI